MLHVAWEKQMKHFGKKLVFGFLISFLIILQSYAETDLQHIQRIASQSGLDPKIVELAFKAQHWAERETNVNKNILAIINYSQPAITPRFYIINLKNDQLIQKTLVAHGRGSGAPNAVPHYFSNDFRSSASSLGVFVAGEAYYGGHGFSRRLIGLEPAINSNAEKRTIVMHPASYVNNNFVGRSLGCLALNPAQATTVIKTLVPGTVIFAYASPENKDPNILAAPI